MSLSHNMPFASKVYVSAHNHLPSVLVLYRAVGSQWFSRLSISQQTEGKALSPSPQTPCWVEWKSGFGKGRDRISQSNERIARSLSLL